MSPRSFGALHDVSSPGLTGRSSKHRPWILDCPVKPGNDTVKNSLTQKLSSRRRRELSEGNSAILLDLATQALFSDRLRDDVDGSIQNRFELTGKGVDSTEISESHEGAFILQSHQHVYVGVMMLLFACARTYQGNARNSGGAQLPFMGAQYRDDVIAAYGRCLAKIERSSPLGASYHKTPQAEKRRKLSANHAPARARSMNSGRSALLQSGIAEMIRAFKRISACSCM
jgi:hypothetical protein